jgi:predicted nucleic acid-binding Zn ribbon protein
MKRIDKIYILDLIINNQPRKLYDYNIIEKLIKTNYLDWFSWFDEKAGRHKHKINATQKGMIYYTENKRKRGAKLIPLLCVVLIVLPIALILMEGIL